MNDGTRDAGGRAAPSGRPGGSVATLREVAALAGVSVSTASRALSGRRRVNEETARRVAASARSLGYSPNEAARMLKLSRSMTFGVTFFNLTTPVGLDLIDGLTDGASERDFSLLVTSARGDPALYRRHIQRFFERRVDGLFLASPTGVEASLEPFHRAATPVLALVSRGPGCGDIPLLTVREQPAIAAAAARLAALGHRRIAFLTRFPHIPGPRRRALDEAAQRLGLALHVAPIARTEREAAVARAVERAVRDEPRATALFVDYREVSKVLPALRALDAPVPDALSLVTFTDSRWTEGLAWPPIAAIHTNTFEMGRRASHLLAAWLDGAEPPDRTELDLAEWVDRPSVGPAPAAPPSRQSPGHPAQTSP